MIGDRVAAIKKPLGLIDISSVKLWSYEVQREAAAGDDDLREPFGVHERYPADGIKEKADENKAPRSGTRTGIHGLHRGHRTHGQPGEGFCCGSQGGRRLQGPGKASEVHVLVYEPKDAQLVRVNVPFWLARKLAKDDEEGVPDGAKKGLRLLALQEAGKGTVVEVEEDNGEQVLVWLR